MNWDAIGAIAEILGAIGVLSTLAYLAIQIRHNSASVDSSTEDGVTSGFNDINIQVASDPKLAKLLTVGLEEPEKLSEEEEVQFSMLWRCYVNQYYRLYILYTKGIFSEDRWLPYAKEISQYCDSPGGKLWRESNKNIDGFWEAVDKHRGEDLNSLRIKDRANDT